MKRLTKDIIFESSHLSQDLARRSVRGGVTTMTAQALQFVLHMAGTMILARLLTPADFGLIGMVTVVVGFAEMFKDAGLSTATVQRATISHEQISTLFWLNVLLSAALGLCILVASPLVAWFYGRPELTPVTAVLSLSFIITGLTIQHSALLRRHMRFGTLAVIHIVSYLINLTVVVLLALAGWRYWALVVGSLATAISGILLTLCFCPWIPGRMRKGTGVRGMLKFGGHLTGFSFLNYFTRNADSVIIGHALGPSLLGIYAKAYSLLLMPIHQINGPLTSVMIPALSRLQKEPDRYRRYYMHMLGSIALLTMPIVTLLFAMANEVILLVLGTQWVGAVPVFRLLAPAALLGAINFAPGLLCVSLGRTDIQLRWALISAPVTVLAFITGIHWGIHGVAIAFSSTWCLLFILFLFWACRKSPVVFGDLCRMLLVPSLGAILASVATLALVARVSNTLHMGLRLLLGTAVFACCYFAFVGATSTGRRLLSSIVHLPIALRARPTVTSMG